jgi:crossover junction endodeoxyribonuclease RuvC
MAIPTARGRIRLRRVTGRFAPWEQAAEYVGKRHPAFSPESVPMQVVMGIDPGAANLGFGIVRVEGSRMVALDGGVVETSAGVPMERRLERIHAELGELISWHEPAAMAVEDVFFGKNAQTAMAVGRASGVAMLAAAQAGVECFAYTPQAIKMAVCGSGSAGKKQVQRMVGTLLGLPEPPNPDHAADALAVAICHGGGVGRREALEATG